MTATNHALTGAIVGLLISQPLIALPTAVASHYIMDAIPHFGFNLPDSILLKARIFRNYLIIEATLCALLVLCLALIRPEHWLLASFCAFAAAAPDLLSANRYVTIRRGGSWKQSAYAKLATGIQWFERPIGMVVEVTWAVACIIVLVILIRT